MGFHPSAARVLHHPTKVGRAETRRDGWVDDDNVALLTDAYELTMLQAYWATGMRERAAFSLFFRELPEHRNYVLACGLDTALRYLEELRFTRDELAFLRQQPELDDRFVDWLADFRFTGDVWAVAEGTPVFADEPLVEIVAPIAEAQLVETFVMNTLHFQSVIASKASRVVHAAAGRAVVDFGARRMHGAQAALDGARAGHVAGLTATSNVLAGFVYGLPLAGTMAHSFIQAHDDEGEALRDFARCFPETTLLVDTYDTLAGVEKVVSLARELGADFRVRAVRLDSGDLAELAFASRRLLDAAGLEGVDIFASGGLDEWAIDRLLKAGAPIDGFGVGTRMGVAADAPCLDMAYKLVAYAGRDRLKLSTGKVLRPGRKQVYRIEEEGRAVGDVLATADEHMEGRPLLEQVMASGRRLSGGCVDLDGARHCAADEVARLPAPIQAIEPADPPYPVHVSAALADKTERMARAHRS